MSCLFKILVTTVFALLPLGAISQTKKSTPLTKTGEIKSNTKTVKNTNKVVKETHRKTEEEFRKKIEERKQREEATVHKEKQIAFERELIEESLANIKSDQTEGEDLEIRNIAINALGHRAGSVVVMESQTGRILTIVNQDWAVRQSFKPCSMIKLVTAIAGLNEGIIEKTGKISYQNYGLNLTDALAYSNNTYFQRVGSLLGNEKFIFYARALGLGEKTGINLEGESSGRLPYSNHNPKIYSHGDSVEVTPIQLAVMISAIANNGKIVAPNIVRTPQKASFQGSIRRQINIPLENLQGVLPGMIGTVNYGTARLSGVSYLNVAGKTGSCIGQGSWLGIFASVAPAINPQFTVVVLTRGRTERGKTAALVAGRIYKALERRFFQTPIYYDVAKGTNTPKPKIDEKISTLLDGFESEEIESILSRKSKSTKKQDVSVLIEDEEARKQINERSQKSSENSRQHNTFKPVIIEPKTKAEKQFETRPRVVKTVISSRIM